MQTRAVRSGPWANTGAWYESLSNWAIGCLAAMMTGALGTGIMPKSVFGLFKRFSTFSAVIFNAVLGFYLMKGAFPTQEE